MDMFCSDKKLSELGEGPLGGFLDNDEFTPPTSSLDHFDGPGGGGAGTMDSDWLENFFDDPVLNDRMISDALQPNVQSEHSYSLANNDQTLDLSKTANTDKELDMELTAVNPMALSNHPVVPLPKAIMSIDQYIKQEPLDLTLDTEMTTVTVTRSTNPQTLLKQPTIILASPLVKQERLVLPKMNIKLEPAHQQQQQHQHQLHHQQQHSHYMQRVSASPELSNESYDSVSLPPTPPSSHHSDSDGSDRSPPCSPMRQLSRRPASPHQPLFMSPIPTSGVLVLTEEEKRTLVSEGYPIPAKLPLTKQEEKNLKKIRRKIKNKISAQESRRKKKEYLETLERKVEAYSQENTDLRKKVDNLQGNNQSLMSQLHKLQALVRGSTSGTPHTSTCLMVLVLCFAVLLGSWSPMSLSIGYSSVRSAVVPAPLPPPIQGLSVAPQQPLVKDPATGVYGPYATPNMRSRVLLSSDEEFGPAVPSSFSTVLGNWLGCSADDEPKASVQPELPRVTVMDVETEINQTGEPSAVQPPSVTVTANAPA